jgi:hypothetical protein
MTPLIAARARDALERRRQGQNLRSIAERYGISRERARQLCVYGEELERQGEFSGDPWCELDPAIRNALNRDGCRPTVDGVLRYYQPLTELERVPSMGAKRIRELKAWLRKHSKDK